MGKTSQQKRNPWTSFLGGKGGKRRRGKAHAERPTVDVVTQLSVAARNRSAAALGAVMGGSVPALASLLAHGEIGQAWKHGNHVLAGVILAVILGCTLFSVLTVRKFGLAAFGEPAKAVGFVFALEGVMLVAQGAASWWALGLLIAVNAITNGCHIALAREATLRRQAADVRRQATAAQTRARQRAERSGKQETRMGSASGATPAQAEGHAQPPVGESVVVWEPRRGRSVPGVKTGAKTAADTVVDAEFEEILS